MRLTDDIPAALSSLSPPLTKHSHPVMCALLHFATPCKDAVTSTFSPAMASRSLILDRPGWPGLPTWIFLSGSAPWSPEITQTML
uniref:Uncharacterized protein n=1 Tax=Physcomitrium patens TaxID=3218 RepID=A0A2K1KCM9_PHYPA|nr:hypothetical protein PHYPA_010724 [Physcomitrium patens]